jgi:TonB family protein
MKNGTCTLLFLLAVFTGFAQKAKYTLPERQTPSATKEMLNQAQYINDISPMLWSSFSLGTSGRYYLDMRRPNMGPQAENYLYPQDNYKQIVNVFFVEITGTLSGKSVTAKSKSDKLTPEQKNILANADLGTDIAISLNYKYKNQQDDQFGPRDNVVEATTVITVVPASEAQFPGGYRQLSEYFAGNVISKVAEKDIEPKVKRAAVKFTVNEEGEVVDAQISRTSSDAQIDRLLLEAINKMPKWKPAVDANGVKVKQVVSIPFGVTGC